MGKELLLFFLLLFYTGLINRALITAPAAHGTRDKWAFSEDTKDFDLFLFLFFCCDASEACFRAVVQW
jgi:hypothetical protein